MVLLELGYLHEIGRVQDFSSLKETLDLSICDLDYLKVINVALELTWTRDPFDRIIVAQSTVNQSINISKRRVGRAIAKPTISLINTIIIFH